MSVQPEPKFGDLYQPNVNSCPITVWGFPQPVSKQYSLDGETGDLVKAPANAGTPPNKASTFDVNTASELADVLDNQIQNNNCITSGITDYSLIHVMSNSFVDAQKPEKTIARTKHYVTHSEDLAGWMILDYDPEAEAPFGTLNKDELIKQLINIWPELASAPIVWRPSAGSCIYDKDGKELIGIKGQRLYVQVSRASSIPLLIDRLNDKLWLAGFGFYKVGKAGQSLKRSIIDTMMKTPNQLDYCCGAVCLDGLFQNFGESDVYNDDKPPVDVDTLLDLTVAKKDDLESIEREAKSKIMPELSEALDKWAGKMALSHKVDDETQYEKLKVFYKRASLDKRLFGDFVLHSRRYGEVTVGELLDDPRKYHNEDFRDPLEPDYNGGKIVARAYIYGKSRPIIHSLAHGKRVYVLDRTMSAIELVEGNSDVIVDKVIHILASDPTIYKMGKNVVEISNGSSKVLGLHDITYKADTMIDFFVYNKKKHTTTYKDCPDRLAKKVEARWFNSSEFNEVDSIVDHPVIMPNGQLANVGGYDAKSKMFLDNFEIQSCVPPNPTILEAEKALKALWYPFSKYSFADRVSKSNALAAILTAILRPVIDLAPGIVVDAKKMGSGKTIFCECLAYINQKKTNGVTNANLNDEELRKSITSLLKDGYLSVIFDNLEAGTVLKSATLAQIITSEVYAGRILGISEMLERRNRLLLMYTGNNIGIAEDLTRRIIRITIDPDCEFPAGVKYPFNPKNEVITYRDEIIDAGLTLIQAARGYKSEKIIGSFGQWQSLVANTVEWIGHNGLMDVVNPVDGMLELMASDPEAAINEGMLTLLYGEYKGRPFRVKDVENSDCIVPLYDDLSITTGRDITKKFMSVDGAIYGAFKLVLVKKDPSNGHKFKVQKQIVLD